MFRNPFRRKPPALPSDWGRVKAYENFSWQRELYDFDPGVAGLDEQAVEDLDFHALYRFLDRCTSIVGQQRLYQRLRSVRTDVAKSVAFGAWLDGFTEDRMARLVDGLSDFKPEKDHVFPAAIYGVLPDIGRYGKYANWLLMACFACFLFGFVHYTFWVILAFLMAGNLFLHYKLKSEMGLFVNIFSRLSRLHSVGVQLLPDAGFSVPRTATVDRALQNLGRFNRRFSLIRAERLSDNEVTVLLWYLLEIVKFITLIDVITYDRLLKQLDGVRKDVQTVYEAVGDLDVALSVLALRRHNTAWSLPDLGADYELVTTGMVHPLIADAVANDFTLGKAGVLVTGSNMAGKSSFIKMLAVNAICAQGIYTVFAAGYRACPWRIQTCVNVSDDLGESTSYFMAEVDRIGQLLATTTDPAPHLIVIDEIFKGTNTIERIAAAKSVLEHLATGRNLVLVSTHDVELVRLLADRYDSYHFQETVRDGQLRFDFQLKPGRMTRSNALEVLRLAGYPEAVVTAAVDLAAALRTSAA